MNSNLYSRNYIRFPRSTSLETSSVLDREKDAKMSESGFHFGIELELLLRPKDMSSVYRLLSSGTSIKFDDQDIGGYRTDVKSVAVELLNKTAIITDNWETADPARGYSVWNVKNEFTILPNAGYAGVEVVSRKLTLSQSDPTSALEEIRTVYEALEAFFEIAANRTTSTHIHFSVLNKPFSDNIHLLKAIAKMVALCDAYNSAIGMCVPKHRNDHKWALQVGTIVMEQLGKSSPTYTDVFNKIDDETDVCRLMNRISGGGGGKFCSWNYGHITKPCGTIEFRRPPGSVTAEDALHWVAFTLCLVQGALLANDATFVQFGDRLASEGITVAEMEEAFIKPGGDSLGIAHHLRRLEAPSELGNHTPRAKMDAPHCDEFEKHLQETTHLSPTLFQALYPWERRPETPEGSGDGKH